MLVEYLQETSQAPQRVHCKIVSLICSVIVSNLLKKSEAPIIIFPPPDHG